MYHFQSDPSRPPWGHIRLEASGARLPRSPIGAFPFNLSSKITCRYLAPFSWVCGLRHFLTNLWNQSRYLALHSTLHQDGWGRCRVPSTITARRIRCSRWHLAATDPELSARYRSLAIKHKMLALNAEQDTAAPSSATDNLSSAVDESTAG
jgi:hypothetical protein